MQAELQKIASRFALEGAVTAIDSLGEGFINDTFIIRTEGGAPHYILQRKNKNIFPDVPAMMENIRKVTDHIRRRVVAEGGDPLREVMTVVPPRDGPYYAVDSPARAARASASSRPSWRISPSRWPRRSRDSTTSATASCSGTKRSDATPQAA